MNLNETYLNGLELSGEVRDMFRDVYAGLDRRVRRELAHSPEGEKRIKPFSISPPHTAE